jgi:hypothetical protein
MSPCLADGAFDFCALLACLMRKPLPHLMPRSCNRAASPNLNHINPRAPHGREWIVQLHRGGTGIALLPTNSWVTRADRLADALPLKCMPSRASEHWTVKHQYAADGADGGTETTDTATPRQSADPNRYPAAAAVEWPACIRLPAMNGLTSIHRVNC